jgi:hypothetical protein
VYQNLDNNVLKSLRLEFAFTITLDFHILHVPLVYGSKNFQLSPDTWPTLLRSRIYFALHFVSYDVHSKIFQTADITNFDVFFILRSVVSL